MYPLDDWYFNSKCKICRFEGTYPEVVEHVHEMHPEKLLTETGEDFDTFWQAMNDLRPLV